MRQFIIKFIENPKGLDIACDWGMNPNTGTDKENKFADEAYTSINKVLHNLVSGELLHVQDGNTMEEAMLKVEIERDVKSSGEN
jgi:hypothetical protein